MSVAELLLETIRDKSALSDQARRVLEQYYSHIDSKSDYWIENSEFAYQYVYRFLKSVDRPRILDVGCGVGTESLAFARLGASVMGVDVTEEYLSCARERLNRFGPRTLDVEFSYANVLDIDVRQPFDAVWMNQAYHHLEPRAEVTAKLASLVRSGGCIFVSDTNAWNPLVQLLLFKQRGFQTTRTYQDKNGVIRPYGRERVTTATAIARAFAKHGFRCTGRNYYKIFPSAQKYARIEALLRKGKWPAIVYANFTLALEKH